MRVATLLVVMGLLVCTSLTFADEPHLILDPGGHSAVIRQLRFTPDGKRLVSVSDDKEIRIWNVQTGKTARVILGPYKDGAEGQIYALDVSKNGQLLAVGGFLTQRQSERGWIRVYDLKTCEVKAVLYQHDSVNSVSFSPDSKHLASGSVDGSINLWDLASQNRIQLGYHGPSLGEQDPEPGCRVHSVAFSPDGDRLVSAGDDGNIQIWDVARDKKPIRIGLSNQPIRIALFSPDANGDYIVAGDDARNVSLYVCNTGKAKVVFSQESTVAQLAFSGDGKLLLTGAGLGRAVCHVIEFPSCKPVQASYMFSEPFALGVAMSPIDHTAAIAGGKNYAIHLWNVDTDRQIKTMMGDGDAIESVGFARDGNSIAFGTTTKLHSANDRGPLEHSISLPRNGQSRLSFTPEIDNSDAYLRAVVQTRGYQLRTMPNEQGFPNAVLEVLKDGELLSRIPLDNTNGRSHLAYTFTHDARFVISGSENGKLGIFDPQTGKQLYDLVGHTGAVKAVAISPDDRTLITGSADETLKLWDLPSKLDQQLVGTKVQELRWLLTFFVATTNEWVAWTPQGYYTSSLNGDRYVGWQVSHGEDKPSDYYPVAQFQSDFCRPDVVTAFLYKRNIVDAVRLANSDRDPDQPQGVLSSSTVTEILPPQITFVGMPDVVNVDSEQFTFDAIVQSNTLPISNVRIYLNGIPQASFDMDTNGKSGGNTKHVALSVHLEPGRNVLSVVASNSRATSLPISRTINFNHAVNNKPLPSKSGTGIHLNKMLLPLQRSPTVAPALYHTNNLHRLSVLIGYHAQPVLPSVVIFPFDDNISTHKAAFPISVEVHSPTLIRDVEVKVNGNTQQSLPGDDTELKFQISVNLKPGKNLVSIVARNTDGESAPQTKTIIFVPNDVKPNLVVVAVGIDYGTTGLHLDFADKDALDFLAAYKNQEGVLCDKIRARLLTDPMPSRVTKAKLVSGNINVQPAKSASILEGLDWLGDTCRTQDIAVIFLSGHGDICHHHYYFLSAESKELGGCNNGGIRWSEFHSRIAGLKCHVLFFVDSCHAAGVAGPAQQNPGYLSLKSFLNVALFVSSDQGALSQELPDWRHGAFTQALLEAFSSANRRQAVKPGKNAKLTPYDVGEYIKKRVPGLTDGQQTTANYYWAGGRGEEWLNPYIYIAK